MERLKPLDLEKANIRRRMRGYDRTAVDALLARASKEIETLLTELQQARDALAGVEREVESYRAKEDLIKESLILAQKAADDQRTAANAEAERIVEAAKRAESEMRTEAQKRIGDLRWEIERLVLERNRFEQRVRALIAEHLKALDEGKPSQPPLVNLEVSDEAV